MSMGMMMLPPVFISLPFKILLFVLVDGWNLVTSSLVQSFHCMTQDKVVSLVVDTMGVTMKVALPMLLVGLVVGLAVSIFQAVTQIQEQTLSFIPKILGAGRRGRDRRPVDARHDRRLDTQNSVRQIPSLVGTDR